VAKTRRREQQLLRTNKTLLCIFYLTKQAFGKQNWKHILVISCCEVYIYLSLQVQQFLVRSASYSSSSSSIDEAHCY